MNTILIHVEIVVFIKPTIDITISIKITIEKYH